MPLAGGGGLEVQVSNVQSLAALRSSLLGADRARSYLTITTASLVVFLAAFGLYGTQRYLVAAGRREYSIRAAIGAGPKALGRLVLRRGLWLGFPGLVFSAPAAFVAVAWIRDEYLSRQISPSAVMAVIVIVMTLILLIASSGPAQQARRTQPAALLRED